MLDLVVRLELLMVALHLRSAGNPDTGLFKHCRSRQDEPWMT
jgi:hypothetical protein